MVGQGLATERNTAHVETGRAMLTTGDANIEAAGSAEIAYEFAAARINITVMGKRPR